MHNSIDYTFNQIFDEIKNLKFNGISDITLLPSKQTELNKDLLKFVFELLVSKFDFRILEIYFSNTYNFSYDNTYENIQIQLQNDFRNKLINLYNRCIITGKSHIICDAVYISPIKHDRYNIYNGLLLCRDLCYLFKHPKRYLKINPYNITIELSDEILNDCACEEYHKYHNTQLKIQLNNTTIQYLKEIY